MHIITNLMEILVPFHLHVSISDVFLFCIRYIYWFIYCRSLENAGNLFQRQDLPLDSHLGNMSGQLFLQPHGNLFKLHVHNQLDLIIKCFKSLLIRFILLLHSSFQSAFDRWCKISILLTWHHLALLLKKSFSFFQPTALPPAGHRSHCAYLNYIYYI